MTKSCATAGKSGGAERQVSPNFQRNSPQGSLLTGRWPGGCSRLSPWERQGLRPWERMRAPRAERKRPAPGAWKGCPGARGLGGRPHIPGCGASIRWPRGRPPPPNGRRSSGPSSGSGVTGPSTPPPAPTASVSSLTPRPRGSAGGGDRWNAGRGTSAVGDAGRPAVPPPHPRLTTVLCPVQGNSGAGEGRTGRREATPE